MTTPTDTHGRVQDSFSAYLDGELAAPDKALVEQHLAACLQCRTHLEQLRRTLGSLGSLKRKAPPTFLPDIQRQIFTRSSGRFFGQRWRLFGKIPFEWLSMAMIVAMLAYYILTQHGAPTSVSPTP